MNRIRIILRQSETLHEMLIGVGLSNVVIMILSLIIANQKMKAVLGVLFGTVVAAIYVIHMAVTIDDALCLDEKGAMTQMRKNMLIRYVAVCACLAIVCITNCVNPICFMFSCLTVKLGAYLQPFVHYKILKRSDEPQSAIDGSEDGGKISE